MSFLTIIIDLDPNIARIGPLLITWHGVFSVLGILAAARLGFWLLGKDVPNLKGEGDGLASAGSAPLAARRRRIGTAMIAIATMSADAICAWRRPMKTAGSVRRKLSTNRPAA